MPPAISESDAASDAASDVASDGEEVIMPRKNSGKQKVIELADEELELEMEEEEEGGESGDESDEVYVVEKILDHDFNFPNNELRYQTKWLGYDQPADLTWEPFENLQGALEVLNAYHKDIGGPPVFEDTKAKASKKRGRTSMGKGASAGRAGSTESATKKFKADKSASKSANAKVDGRRKIKAYGEGSHDEDTLMGEAWLPQDPLPGSWEEKVIEVETIDCDDDGTKWALLKWAQTDPHGVNRRSRSLLKTAHFACPQMMLKFYELHLKFFDKNNNKKATNGAEA